MAQLPGRCRYDPSNRVLCLQFYYKVDIEIELPQIDRCNVRFAFFPSFFHLSDLIEKTGDLIRTGDSKKNLTVRTVRFHVICDK